MVQSTKTFRIFVSSTFSDLKEERNALQKNVFPKLRDLCTEHGFRFQAIDLRWGVSEEAGLDQQTMKICLEEIERSQMVSPKPNFIVLLGDRYGWIPLPYEIPADEFEEIKSVVEHENDRKFLFWDGNVLDDEQLKKREGWYCRDDNAVPPVYCLKPRLVDYDEDASDDEIQGAKDKEAKDWEEREKRLKAILFKAIVDLGWDEDDPRRSKYESSATEQEINNGVLNPPPDMPDPEEHVFCFFREIDGIEKVPYNQHSKDFLEFDEKDQILDKESQSKLEELKEKLRDELPLSHIFSYHTKWNGNRTRTDHLDKLGEDVLSSLEKIIKKQIDQYEEQEPLDLEIEANKKFGEERSRHFLGRAEILEDVENYLKQRQDEPLAIYGVSGSGKTALMAYLVQKAKKEHPKSEVIHRYIGATATSSDIRSLLEGLCNQISDVYGFDQVEIPTEYHKLVQEFPIRLSFATDDNPLIIFIDALDQLSDVENARQLAWLPTYQPENVHIIVSTTPGECLSVLEEKLPDKRLLELGNLKPEEGKELLNHWLQDASRKLVKHQSKEVLEKFSDNGLPLYLKLTFGEVTKWNSYTDPQNTILSDEISDIIGDMLNRLSLESNHGEVMVSKSLGYLAASRYGLSEDEIIDILSLDREVFHDFMRRARSEPTEILENLKPILQEDQQLKSGELFRKLQIDQEFTYKIFQRAQKEKLTLKIPLILWSRLFFDLEFYLTERNIGETSLLNFYHGQLGEVVKQEYLSVNLEKAFHLHLADYFEPRNLDDRKVDELPWQLNEVESWGRLAKLLKDLQFLSIAWKRNEFDVKTYWAQIQNKSNLRMIQIYKRYLDLPSKYESSHILILSLVLYDTGHISNTLKLQDYLIEHYRKTGERYNLQLVLGNKAIVCINKGKYDFAMKILQEQENTCRLIGDKKSLARVFGNMGIIFKKKGKLDDALKMYKKNELICKELGEKNCIQISLGNQAGILVSRHQLEDALQLLKQKEEIAREIGNKESLSSVFGNQAIISNWMGDFDGANMFLKKQEEIAREIGDKVTLSISLGNQALILRDKNDLDGAMKLLKAEEKILRELGYKEYLSNSLGNQALILRDKNDLDGAMKLLKEEEEFSREIGNMEKLSISLVNQALIFTDWKQPPNAMTSTEEALQIFNDYNYVSLKGKSIPTLKHVLSGVANHGVELQTSGNLDGAMKLHIRVERACIKLDDKDCIQNSKGNQAFILKSQGDLIGAMQLLKEEEQICLELGDKDCLQNSKGNQALVLKSQGDLMGAMDLLGEQEQICSDIVNLEGLSRCFINKALILFALNQTKNARSLAKKALRIAHENHFIMLEKQIISAMESMK